MKGRPQDRSTAGGALSSWSLALAVPAAWPAQLSGPGLGTAWGREEPASVAMPSSGLPASPPSSLLLRCLR